jgi:hypothetical protein
MRWQTMSIKKTSMADLLHNSRKLHNKRVAQSLRTRDMESGPRLKDKENPLGEGIPVSDAGPAKSNIRTKDILGEGTEGKQVLKRGKPPVEELEFGPETLEEFYTDAGENPLSRQYQPDELFFDPDEYPDTPMLLPDEDPLVKPVVGPDTVEELGYDPLNPLGLTGEEEYDLQEMTIPERSEPYHVDLGDTRVKLEDRPGFYDELVDEALKRQDERSRRKR